MKAIAYDRLEATPVGDLYVAVSEKGVISLAFDGSEERFRADLAETHGVSVRRDPERAAGALGQLKEYFSGSRERFDIYYDLGALTPFQRSVLEAVQRVPKGSYVTYRQLAESIGRPKASRAVGQALGRNPIPIMIPCHRVIAADGSLGGYSGAGGLDTKRALLEFEGADL